MQVRFPDFLSYFFVYNHFQRFTGTGFNNPMPFWFYLPVVLMLTLPWSFWLPAAWARTPRHDEPGPTIRSLMWIWLAVVIGFFSIPSSKLVGYVLPALPPLAYLLADGLGNRWGEVRGARVVNAFAAGAAGLCLATVIAYALLNAKSDKELSHLIAQRRQTGEPVLFVRKQFFDVPFYLGLRAPVQIFDDWRSADGPVHDNWHKTMVDAARFDPDRAKALLLDRSRLEGVVCSRPVSWLIAMNGEEKEYPFLRETPPLATHSSTSVWRLTPTDVASAGGCGERPEDAAAGRSDPPSSPG